MQQADAEARPDDVVSIESGLGSGATELPGVSRSPRYAAEVLARIQAIRYVTPLREGGSLPGVVEADDLGTYVAKFRGAGQGRRALVAEVIVTELARSLGL